MTEDNLGKSELVIRRNLLIEDEKVIRQLLKTGLSYKEVIPTLQHLKKRREESVLAIYDPLTRLLCKNETENRVFQEVERAKRHKHSVSILFLDIDEFKGFNDKYGHEIGDIILMELGFTLEDSTRSSDIVGRFGGEEFVILLPETPLRNVKNLLRDLGEGFRKNKVLRQYGVTLSVGGSGKSAHDKTANHEELLRNADAALLHAKQTGKNRVVTFNEKKGKFDLLLNPFITYG